ncbi:MAG: alpha/beta hydrolase [Candidatus Nanoarchaeia archaeon]|nr:alpha/beta hydrolase [Candidatus Nanoarchaeia archaeon]MDD5741619.1 alpha/beta hydrolase [Candidatus Nanoarchaeia archaeon]
MKQERIIFKNADGLKLCGILSKSDYESNICIILCHGITVDKEEDGIFTNLAKEIVETNRFNVFRFDFRGHGESEGKSEDMTITGEKRDLEAAINLLKGRSYSRFGILAASFAGGAVCLYCGEHPEIPKALVLWNALIDYSSKINPVTEWGKRYWGKPAFDRVKKQGYTEIGSRKFKVGKEFMSEIKNLKPWKELKKLNIPILFVHGDKDAHIPYGDSVKYSKMFKKGLATIKGAEHGFHDNKEDAEEANNATINFFYEVFEK